MLGDIRILPFTPFLDRAGMLAPVQLDAILVQDAEHRAATTETTGFPDLVNGMPRRIEVDNRLFPVHASLPGGGDRRQLDYHAFLQF